MSNKRGTHEKAITKEGIRVHKESLEEEKLSVSSGAAIGDHWLLIIFVLF